MDNKRSHNYEHEHEHHNISTSSIKLTFFLNTIFAIVEFFAGLYTNSVTISSNAIHDFGDSIILFFSFLLENKSKKGRSEKYTYGYRRFSILGSMINSLILFVGAIIILDHAISRLTNPEPIRGFIMMGFAIFGILVNGIGAYKLFKERGGNQRALFLNIFSDFISWISILFSSILVVFFEITIVDSLISILMATWLIYHSIKEVRHILTTLMQAVPPEIELADIKKTILTHELVCDVHDLHIWNLDGEDYISSFHIVVKDTDMDKVMSIKEQVKIDLEQYGINHSTVEVDTIKQAQINGEL